MSPPLLSVVDIGPTFAEFIQHLVSGVVHSEIVQTVAQLLKDVGGLGHTVFVGAKFCFTSSLGLLAYHPMLLVTGGLVITAAKLYEHHYSQIVNASDVFDGESSQPFCVYCSPDIKRCVADLGRDFYKVCLIPNGCDRCCYVPALHGYTPIQFLVSSDIFDATSTYGTLRLNKVRDVHGPTANQFDAYRGRSYKAAFVQRHFGKLSRYERTSSFTWIEETHSYCYATPWLPINSEWQAQAVVADGADGVPCPVVLSPLNTMRNIWSFIGDHGVYPAATAVSCQWVRLRELMVERAHDPNGGILPMRDHITHLYQSVHSRLFQTGAEPAPYMTPPMREGQPITVQMAAPAPLAQVVGPVVRNTTVHNSSDAFTVHTAAESRCNTEPIPGSTTDPVERHKFKKDSETGKRYRKFFALLNKQVFTEKAVMDSYNRLFGAIGEITDERFSKFQTPEVKKEFERMQTYVLKDFSKVKATGKAEQVDKQNKAVRFVYDNSLTLLIMYYMMGHIVEDITFGEYGIFRGMSIKGRDRKKVLDEFIREHATVIRHRQQEMELCGVEIDQTSMENHERIWTDAEHELDGGMLPVYEICQKVCLMLVRKFGGDMNQVCGVKMSRDANGGLQVKIKIKAGPTCPQDIFIKLKFPDLFLISGWLLTSWSNFLNEEIVTLCSMVLNPEHLLSKDGNGRFRLINNIRQPKNSYQNSLKKEEDALRHDVPDDALVEATDKNRDRNIPSRGDFNWMFKSIPLLELGETDESKALSRTIYWCMKFEGDDGAGRTDVRFSYQLNSARVVLNLRDAGFSGKLVCLVTGRLEFVGAHMRITNGRTSPNAPWTPAMARYVGKLGIHVSTSPDLAASWARHISLGLGFVGKNEPMQRLFFGLASLIERECADMSVVLDEQTIMCDVYSEVARFTGLSGHVKLSDLRDLFTSRASSVLKMNVNDQVALMKMSYQDNDINVSDYNKLSLAADSIEEMHEQGLTISAFLCPGVQETFYAQMPACSTRR